MHRCKIIYYTICYNIIYNNINIIKYISVKRKICLKHQIISHEIAEGFERSRQIEGGVFSQIRILYRGNPDTLSRNPQMPGNISKEDCL